MLNVHISVACFSFLLFHSQNISDDMNYILSQIEKQDGLSSGQAEEIICTLWNKRELAYMHLREYELQIEELQIHDNNNIVDGLKVIFKNLNNVFLLNLNI